MNKEFIGDELIKYLKVKFGHVSRGAIIIGIPYQQIIDAVRFNRPWKIKEIWDRAKAYQDCDLPGELTPYTRKKIGVLWSKATDEFKANWSASWVDILVNSKRRMRETQKVKELIKQLQK